MKLLFQFRSIAVALLVVSATLLPARSDAAEIGYTYDELGRLIAVSYPNGVVTRYTYDALGNRITVVAGGLPVPPSPPQPDDGDWLLIPFLF